MDNGEVMNSQIEKFFFTWILDHPAQFHKVEPTFFKNDDISFIYKVVRDEYIVSKIKKTPSPQQIVAMIKLNDPEEKISNNIIKAILKNDNSVHDQGWLEERFRAWKMSNTVKDRVYESIEKIRNLREIDYGNVSDVTSQIKSLFNNLSLIEDDSDDLGADFDDPEMHKQEISRNKIPSGWGNVDLILSGGWDKGTFNVLMGETSVGKCLIFNTLVKIRNKKTKEVLDIQIGDFYEMLKTDVGFD